MVIRGIKQTLPGVYEITPDAGSAFFLRKEYLTQVSEERLIPYGYGRLDVDLEDISNAKEGDAGFFTEEETADLFNASLYYSVEKAAMSYLARAEHCRSGLLAKLIKKGLDKKIINTVLDFLESENLLSDLRFAGAWLRSRSIDHAEGRIRLSAELASRGVEKNAAKTALDEYFAENSQEELCRKAFKKLFRTKKDPEKLRASLMRQGFSLKEINLILKENLNNQEHL